MPWPMRPRPTTPTVVISFTFASRLALLAFSCSLMKRSSSVEPALQNRLRARRVDGVMWTPRRTLAVERLFYSREASRARRRVERCRVLARSMLCARSDAAVRFASTRVLKKCVREFCERVQLSARSWTKRSWT